MSGGIVGNMEVFYDVLEIFIFGDVDNIDCLFFGEGGNGDDIVNFEIGSCFEVDFVEYVRGFVEIGFFGVGLFS